MYSEIYNNVKQNVLKKHNVNIDGNEQFKSIITTVFDIVNEKYKNKNPSKIYNFVVKKCTDKISTKIEDEKIISTLMQVENNQIKSNTENLSLEEKMEKMSKERGLGTNDSFSNPNELFSNNNNNNSNNNNTVEWKNKEESVDALTEFLNERDQSRSNLVDNIEPIEKETNINNTVIENNEEQKDQLKLQYDLNAPDKIVFGNKVDTSVSKSPIMLILDTGDLSTNNIETTFELVNDIELDDNYEMILEFITLQNVTNLERQNLLAIMFDAPGVHFATHSNNSQYESKYIFPNEIFGKNDNSEASLADDTNNATSHTIKLKTNYMGSIQAGKYNKFRFKLYGNNVSSASSNTLEVMTGADLNSVGGRIILGILLK